MEKISVTTQLLNEVLGYLATKPYQEVYKLVSAIQQEADSNRAVTADTAPDDTEA